MDELRPPVTASRRQSVGGRAPVCAAFLLVGAVLFASAACSSPAVLANTLPSDEAVVRAVLDAVRARDAEALMRLSITQEEFERVVWPSLPVSRPEVGMPVSYVWQDTRTKSRAYLESTLQRWGGQRLQFVRVYFDGRTTDHDSYSLSRKTHIVVRDETGTERTVRLFGSIIRQAGRSKIYSFIVD